MRRCHRQQRARFGRLAAALLALSSCANPGGPVYGAWEGRARGPVTTVLTLYGPPHAASGQYLIQITVPGTQIGGGSGLTTWSGDWTATPASSGTLIHLGDPLATMIDRYVLTGRNVLEPAPGYYPGPISQADLREYSLYPIRPW